MADRNDNPNDDPKMPLDLSRIELGMIQNALHYYSTAPIAYGLDDTKAAELSKRIRSYLLKD